ncbi:Chloride channel protein clh-3 [Aphelenchoides fujianensis]|nr:Chloride channel protein clh-3 [Aphelenchoides fujianensis]
MDSAGFPNQLEESNRWTKWRTRIKRLLKAESERRRREERGKSIASTWTQKKSGLSQTATEWIFLAILGVAMAVISALLDATIKSIGDCMDHSFALKTIRFPVHIFILEALNPLIDGWTKWTVEYVVWVGYAVLLTTLSSFCVRTIGQQAVGSGIPEMKTILRGSHIEDYLSFRTLIALFIGLAFTIGSGMPLGRAGGEKWSLNSCNCRFFMPIRPRLGHRRESLLKFDPNAPIMSSLQGEALAAGAAIGTACVFGAPIGGVLFAIECTSLHFATRNYWRGLFAAACATTALRLLRVAFGLDVTVGALYPTSFTDDSFFPDEFPLFAALGVACGLISAAFIVVHRRLVMTRRTNPTIKKFFDQHWSIYPITISFLVSACSYPNGLGNLMGGEVISTLPSFFFYCFLFKRKFGPSVRDFFSNCTWTAEQNSSVFCPLQLRDAWLDGDQLNPFVVLSCFVVVYFFLGTAAATLPIPQGASGTAFTLGGALGRLVGEAAAVCFPRGLRTGGDSRITPGVYALVGASALCGGLTQTLSSAVISFEISGDLAAILPVLVGRFLWFLHSTIAVLIANAVSSFFQPSFYQSLIDLKGLPYLPDVPPSINCHGITVEQFMTRNPHWLTATTTYAAVQRILQKEATIQVFPVVESEQNPVLIGTCRAGQLKEAVERVIGADRRRAEAEKRAETLRLHSQGALGTKRAAALSTTVLTALKTRRNAVNPLEPAHVDADEDGSSMTFTVTPAPSTTPSSTPTLSALMQSAAMFGGGMGGPKKKLSFKHVTQKLMEVREKTGLASDDLWGEERREWEAEQLGRPFDLASLQMDSSPFRLVAGSSLLDTHSLFAVLCLNRAYVTRAGQLIGVVTLADIRQALKDVQAGVLFAQSAHKQSNEQEQQPGGLKRRFSRLRSSLRISVPNFARRASRIFDEKQAVGKGLPH